MPHTDLQTLLQLAVCTLPTEELCKNLVFFLFGYSEHIDEVSDLKNIIVLDLPCASYLYCMAYILSFNFAESTTSFSVPFTI